MQTRRLFWIIPAVLALATAAGAATPPTDTPTDMPTVTVTPTNTPLVTATPVLSATPTATLTITPVIPDTPTASPTPTAIQISAVHIDHNRFNPLTAESMQVMGLRPEHGRITIRVLTQAGALVRNLVDAQEVGGMVPVWDGRNDQGETVASGVYVIVVSGNRLHKKFRIAVLK